MARSRSSSFSDDDLQIVSSQALSSQGLGSQMADMSLHSSPAKSPLRPIEPNGEVVSLASSPAAERTNATDAPVFGKPSKMHSLLYKKKEKSIFNPNKGRPEHHRPKQIVGPSAPVFADVKQAAAPTFSTLPASQPAVTSDGYPLSTYHQSSAAFADVQIYTDPAKADADLKALLEGGMDEEEEEAEGTLEDGVVEGLKVKLLPHQTEGFKWMKTREIGPVKKGKVTKGGILADDMGLGKTLQSISLLLSNRKPQHDEKGWKKHFDGVEKTTLVVAPLALIRQWETELKEKVSKSHRLNVCVHHGPQRTKRYQDLARYDVVITTYQILVSEFGHSNDTLKVGCFGLHWYRVILDEAHSIKNRNAKSTKACCALRSEFRWCLTGTPMQNNLDELQSLVNFLRIPPYDDYKEWKEHIDNPLKNGRGHIAIRRLHSVLRCFMKRRTKDILKEEGALNPGGKRALEAAEKNGGKVAPAPAFKVTERNIVTVSAEFSPAERRFYGRLEQRAEDAMAEMMEGSMNYANALVLLLRLRQACNHPRLLGFDLSKDKDAMSMDTAQPKAAAGDVDALADALSGMGIQAKRCEVCMNSLPNGAEGAVCDDCAEDREKFNGESAEMKRSKKKHKTKKVVKEQIKVELVTKKRKQRNRRAIIDSDDEEDEGSWLVGEGQQGSLRLGKAGGEDDENAEGGGESIHSDDSDHSSEDEDGSRLDSFVVDDEPVDDGGQGHPYSSEEESFVSVSKLHSQVVQQPASQATSTGTSSDDTDNDSADDDDSGASESDIDSDENLGKFLYKKRPKKGTSGNLLPSAKIRHTLQILQKEAHEHKFIVFSQFTSMLDLLEPFLRKAGFRFARYDGKMRNDEREASLTSLRQDPHTRVLLCSLKCGALGLNLTAATRVIILEPFWNPFVEEQAIDRVHRLTQTVDVTVYKLTVADTVEGRIVDLQDKKRLLAEQAIEGGMRKKDGGGLGLKEIMDLFRHDHHDHHRRGGGETRDDRDYGDNGGVAQDVRSMVGGILRRGDGRKATNSQSQGDPVYNRRW